MNHSTMNYIINLNMKILLGLLILVLANCGLKDQKTTHQVELSVSADGNALGNLKINLFGDDVPKTVANFVGICKGDQMSKVSGVQLSYANTPFHRVIP